MTIQKKLVYKTIVFQLTNKCNAKCRMCCESSSPHLNTRLDRNIIVDTIDAISKINNIRLIGVTGGEPFLYPDDVITVAESCKEIGRQFSITTNAFWCDSYSHTHDMLRRLKENALAICFVSTDAFHEEYIPIERVKVLLQVCGDLRIPVKIQTNSTKSSFTRTDEIIKELGVKKLYSEVLYAGAYPVGMAKENIPEKDYFTRKLEHAQCPYYHIMLIAPDGQIKPCCSPCYAGIPFDFGNIYTDSIENILNRLCENALMRLIVYEGFANLLEEAKRELGYIELDEYVDGCHLCNHLLSDPNRFLYLEAKAREVLSNVENLVSTITW